MNLRDLMGMLELALHDFGQELNVNTSKSGEVNLVTIVSDAMKRRPDLAAKALALAIKIEVAKNREES